MAKKKKNQRPKADEAFVDLELRLRPTLHIEILRIVAMRIIGDNVSDVVNHLLRQHLFEQMYRARLMPKP